MAPGPSFYIIYNLIYLLLIITAPVVAFALFHFIIQLTALCSARPERLTTSPPLGTKYFGWVCAGPRLLKVKRQRSSTFTSLLISKSYWFDKPRFVNEGKLLLTTSTHSVGAQPNSTIYANQAVLWRRCRGSWTYSKGSLTLSITLLCFCLACFISR